MGGSGGPRAERPLDGASPFSCIREAVAGTGASTGAGAGAGPGAGPGAGTCADASTGVDAGGSDLRLRTDCSSVAGLMVACLGMGGRGFGITGVLPPFRTAFCA